MERESSTPSPRRSPKALLSRLSDISDSYTGSKASSSGSSCHSVDSMSVPLAPPLPFPLQTHNPREAMRLAKLAAMHEEVQEAEGRRERRRSRRASSIAGQTPRSKVEMLPSVDEDQPALHGILRSTPPPEPRVFLVAPPPTPPSLGRRRSSRVRFSEELQESANAPDEITTPDVEVLVDTPAPTKSPRSSISSISSTATDPFGLQCSYGSPIPSRAPSGADLFQPKDLPYRRLSQVLARLNSDTPATETLRDIIERPSLAEVEPRLAVPSRNLSVWSNRSLDPSSRSSATSLSAAADILSRDDSIASGVSSVYLPPRLSAPEGAAYASLLPNHAAEPKTPVLNRQPWLDGDLGLSPRSGPFSHPPDGDLPFQDLGPRPESFVAIPESPKIDLKLPQKSRTHDSIDLLPIPQKQQSIGTTDALMALGIKSGHHRQASDISLDLSFPLPPTRLNVSLAKLVIPARKRASLVLAPVITPVEAVVEEGDAVEVEKPIPRAESPLSSHSIPTSPCPDAYSLSAAVMQVGSPIRDQAPLSPDSAAPDSPNLGDMIAQTLRLRRSTVKSYNFDDSDLGKLTFGRADVDTPIKPRTHRLKRIPTTSANDLKSGVGLTRGQGWSGSDSEEEEWQSTIRSIALRRTSKPNLTTQSRKRPVPKLSRYSGTSSSNSEVSTSTTLTELSPTSTDNTLPGRYPWGKSPNLSPIKEPVALPEMRRRSSGMPLPKRDEEWGEPEVLNDEEGDWYWEPESRTLTTSRAALSKVEDIPPVEVGPAAVPNALPAVAPNPRSPQCRIPSLTKKLPVSAAGKPVSPPTSKTPLPWPMAPPRKLSLSPLTPPGLVSPLPASRIPTLTKKPSTPSPKRNPSLASPLRTSLTLADEPTPAEVIPTSSLQVPTPKAASIKSDRSLTSSRSPSPAASRVSSLNKRAKTPPRTPSPPPDTLGDFVARARATRKLNTPPSSSPAPQTPITPLQDDAAPPVIAPRLSLGARLADLIAKRDAMAAGRPVGSLIADLVEEAVEVEQKAAEPVEVPEPAPVAAPKPVLRTAPKQVYARAPVKRPTTPCSNINRFF